MQASLCPGSAPRLTTRKQSKTGGKNPVLKSAAPPSHIPHTKINYLNSCRNPSIALNSHVDEVIEQ